MNPTRLNPWSLVAAMAPAALIASTALATPRCEAPTFPYDRIACEKAKVSPEALRRYIDRTRSVYMLYFWDYMSESDLDKYHAQRQAPTKEQPARDERPRAEAANKL